MKVLALDTSTPRATLAVVSGDAVLAEIADEGGDHSDRLIGLVDDVLRAAGLTLGEVDALAIGAGPGSFTGLRIGMATAKGLAFAADKPLWVVSSLRALAVEAAGRARELSTGPEPITRIATVTDARRREVFFALFDCNGNARSSEHVVAPAHLAGELAQLGAAPSTTLLVGEALELYPEMAPELARRLREPRRPSAAGVARAALSGDRVDGRNHATPAYVRPSEAEIRFPHGNPGGTFAPDGTSNA